MILIEPSFSLLIFFPFFFFQRITRIPKINIYLICVTPSEQIFAKSFSIRKYFIDRRCEWKFINTTLFRHENFNEDLLGEKALKNKDVNYNPDPKNWEKKSERKRYEKQASETNRSTASHWTHFHVIINLNDVKFIVYSPFCLFDDWINFFFSINENTYASKNILQANKKTFCGRIQLLI